MPTLPNDENWQPYITVNLETISTGAFKEVLVRIAEWAKSQPAPGPIDMPNDRYTVTPQWAEDFLRRNGSNRKVSLATVRKYFHAMAAKDWRKTGQPLIFNTDGGGDDLQHRCLASYLGNVSFPSYIIFDAPADPDNFAYIDDCKPRSSADALYTAGLDGLSSSLAGAIKLSWRYDHGALAILQQPRIREMSVREILEYSRTHKELTDAGHLVMGTYMRAVSVIRQKPVAIFFGFKVLELHGEDVLSDFLSPLGSGANLDEDSPILALRNRLQSEGEEESEIKKERRLALMIKAFNMYIQGRTVGKGGLTLKDNEKFPQFEGPQTGQEAAE